MRAWKSLPNLLLALLATSACGGIDRDEAAALVRDAYFGPGDGLTLQVRLPPAALIESFPMLGQHTVPIGDCAQHAIGWEDLPAGIECVRALAEVGAVTSCGSARLSDAVAGGGSPIELLQPLPMGCGRERFGADVRLRGRADLADARHLLFVATFASTALSTERCTAFLDRSETAVLDAARPFGSRRAEWVSLGIVVPGTRTFTGLTGITEGENGAKIAEFTWEPDMDRIAPLMAQSACQAEGGRWPAAGPRTSRAILRRFDDGWRVETVEWSAPQGGRP